MAVVHTGRPLQIIVPSPSRNARCPFRMPLACLYAAPSPQISASRPSCRHPRYSGRWLIGGGAVAVAVGGLGPAAIVGGPRSSWLARSGVGTGGLGAGDVAQSAVATRGVATGDVVIQRCCAGRVAGGCGPACCRAPCCNTACCGMARCGTAGTPCCNTACCDPACCGPAGCGAACCGPACCDPAIGHFSQSVLGLGELGARGDCTGRNCSVRVGSRRFGSGTVRAGIPGRRPSPTSGPA